MDEALLKSGQYPNIAIEAGTDPAEVMREHGREVIPDGEKYELADTREELEADIEMYYVIGIPSVNSILDWLDRQAAITERECMSRDTSERVGWDCAECAEGLGKELDARCDPLKERIAELEEERDLWLERYTQAHRYANEITDERDALKKQINRFDVPKSEEIAENGTTKGVINNFDVQNDSREKLEADVYDFMELVWGAGGRFAKGLTEYPPEHFVEKCIALLDRQAAITERELCAECEWPSLAAMPDLEQEERIAEQDRRIVEYAEQVDSLTAEVEAQRKRANDAERGVLDGGWYVCRDRYEDDIAELTAERDRLQERNDRQGKAIDELKADLDACETREKAAVDYDFRTAAERWEQAYEGKCGEVVRLTAERDQLKADLKTANDTCNTLRASVAGLKMTVDRLNARDGSGRGKPGGGQ